MLQAAGRTCVLTALPAYVDGFDENCSRCYSMKPPPTLKRLSRTWYNTTAFAQCGRTSLSMNIGMQSGCLGFGACEHTYCNLDPGDWTVSPEA